jgi:N-acyl-D-aspartate/D-glutamate deacylase
MNDLLIRNATLYDGLGSPGAQGDLAVKDGRIAALGKTEGTAKEVIDAAGLALMPGIIDNHTHYDAQLTWDPYATPSPALGVTTAIIGNCGFTIAPCKPQDRELVMQNLTQVEGMGIETLRAGIRWEFESFPQYMDMLERQGAALNIAAFVGHSSIRTFVMGADAPKRAATADEVAQMRAIVVEAMQAGAIGFATSTSPAHNGHGGLPMPSRLADEDELRTLVTSLKDSGRGVFMLTKGGQSKPAFLESLAAESGRPVIVAALLHNPTNPNVVFDELDAISAANGRGRVMMGAISCCPLSFDFTLESPYPIESLAAWQPAFALRGEARKAKLADPAFRQSIRDELARPAQVRNFNGEWHKVQVVETVKPGHAKFEQRTLADLAREAGKDPLDFFFDLALAEDLQTVFVALTMNSDEEAVARLIRHPYSLVSLSDAGAHLTFFNDAGFGLHLLGHWARAKGVLTLPQAVYRLTGQPAQLFGIRDRGQLRAGMAADLMLFDPQTVDRGPRQRVRDLPAGGARLTTPAIGVRGVWVNGQRIADRNGLLDMPHLPGKLLRDFAATQDGR